MPANSRWNLIRALKGYIFSISVRKCYVLRILNDAVSTEEDIQRSMLREDYFKCTGSVHGKTFVNYW